MSSIGILHDEIEAHALEMCSILAVLPALVSWFAFFVHLM